VRRTADDLKSAEFSATPPRSAGERASGAINYGDRGHPNHMQRPPALCTRTQADADLAAGTLQTSAGSMGLTDQLERLAPVIDAGQHCASSELTRSARGMSSDNWIQ